MSQFKASIEYSLYIPTLDNEAQAFSEAQLKALKTFLIEKFGGLTDTKHKNKGEWKMGSVKFKDDIVVWRVLAKDSKRSDYLMKKFKEKLKKALKQKDILIVRANVRTL